MSLPEVSVKQDLGIILEKDPQSGIWIGGHWFVVIMLMLLAGRHFEESINT